MRRVRRRLAAVTVGASVLGLVMSTAVAHANEPGADALPAQIMTNGQLPESVSPDILEAAAGSKATVDLSLVTGDTVQVGLDSDGSPVVKDTTVAAREDGRQVVFHTVRRDGEVYVVPSDALSLIEEGTLDWELFNLAKLAEHAAAGTVGEVPVIVSHRGGFSTESASAPARVEGAEVERTFDSIDASAVTIDGNGDWWQQVSAETSGGPAAMSRSGGLAGVEKVWLNELHEIHLADSVPQVGAPVAWDNGYDGSGVTVAVLDTGIDAEHPDVAGKIGETVDFTDSPNGVVDGNGHGTHVAATVAGTGDASDGLRPGVAPGADLTVGKVCDDNGSCPTDAILAGMEWAAQSGADVVNMSLGGSPTDGTDPMSQMVNQLSADYGTLFAIAAGNSGPGSYSVGTPAAADAALAVAAVDKADEMADFSSRGPRQGDDALKPEIAAPGVGIVAARAEGTSLGTSVGEDYTTASGTSMATPHVAGGAAVVAQAFPELSGQELKALLMGTALDLGHDIFAQGAGRLDLARAIDPGVFSGGNISLGRLEYPHQPVSDEATFHNVTGAPVTLSLSGSMTTADGTPAKEGLFTLGADEVTVPADGTAGVGVSVDGSVLGDDDPFGVYSGTVEARDSEGDLRASFLVRVFLEPESFQLTINTIAPDGASNFNVDAGVLMPAENEVLYRARPPVPEGDEVTVEVFGGTYSLHKSAYWEDESGARHTALPVAPEVTIDSDTTVEFDLNQAERAAVELDRETETYSSSLSIDRVSATGTNEVASELTVGYGANEPNVWVLPSEEVEHGTLTVTSDHSLVPPTVSLRAIGGGPAVDLAPRYAAPDVSVPGPPLRWGERFGLDLDPRKTRPTQLPVPRLDTGGRPVDLAYAGTGTAEELAEAGVDGKLVLITPTDFCAVSCVWERPIFPGPELKDRVAAAAEAGVVGVLVVGDPEVLGNRRIGIPSPGQRARGLYCGETRDECPEMEPYAAAPVLTVPAEQGHTVIDRLSKRPVVKALVRGDSELPEAYGWSYTGDSVPGNLPFQVERSELDRVEHRIHDDTPVETGIFGWTRFTPETGQAARRVDFPNVATQRSVTTFVGPARDNAIDRFQTATLEFEEPYVVALPPGYPEPQEGQGLARGLASSVDDRVLSGDDVITWNSGQAMLPGAVQPVTTDQGFTVDEGICSGCREGNSLWPTVYTTGSNGLIDQNMTGLHDDTGAGWALFGANGCGPPWCEVDLYDAAGDELEQTLTPIETVTIVGSGNASEGSVSGAGVIEEGTSR